MKNDIIDVSTKHIVNTTDQNATEEDDDEKSLHSQRFSKRTKN